MVSFLSSRSADFGVVGGCCAIAFADLVAAVAAAEVVVPLLLDSLILQ